MSKKYESVGTLSYQASSKTSLFFVPDSDHFLKYSADSYAVFVGPCLPHTKDREALAVRLRDDGDGIILKKSIPINVSSYGKPAILQVARRAAEQQTRVTLKVTKTGGAFDLESITLPPR